MTALALVADSVDGVELIDSIDAFEALADAWHELGPQRRGPLVSHDWWSCAARAFGVRPHVLVLRRGSRLAAVAPLCRIRRRGIERLEFIGAQELFEPAQLPAVDDDALATLCAAIAAQGLPMSLHRLEADDPAIAMLARLGATRVLPGPATHFLPRGTQWGEVCGSLEGYRRKLRKLAARGAVTSEVVSPSSQDVARELDDVFRVEGSGWKGRRGSSLAKNRELGEFMRALAQRLARRGELRIARLACGGRTVAVQLCVEACESFWVLKMGFDEVYAAASPGLVGNVDLLRHALEGRACGFEFLGLAEDWQRQWNPRVRNHCTALFYPGSVRGFAARAVDGVISWTAALARRKGA